MNGKAEIGRDDLSRFFDELLEPQRFADYGPNGLQVEGVETVGRVAFAVSATRDSVLRAAADGAHALVVHHGLFWKFHGARPLTGPFGRRVLPLVVHRVNLFAYHLPLDAHPRLGNAATLGRGVGLTELQPFGDHQGMPTGCKGLLPDPVAAEELQRRLAEVLQRPVLRSLPGEGRPIRSVGIITGAASGEWVQAERDGLDAFVTGELREHDWHEAAEAGIHLFAGGHHATERLGVRALMAEVEARLGLECRFLDSDNPA